MLDVFASCSSPPPLVSEASLTLSCRPTSAPLPGLFICSQLSTLPWMHHFHVIFYLEGNMVLGQTLVDTSYQQDSALRLVPSLCHNCTLPSLAQIVFILLFGRLMRNYGATRIYLLAVAICSVFNTLFFIVSLVANTKVFLGLSIVLVVLSTVGDAGIFCSI